MKDGRGSGRLLGLLLFVGGFAAIATGYPVVGFVLLICGLLPFFAGGVTTRD